MDRGGAMRVDGYRASRRNPDRTQTGSRRTVIRRPHRRANHKAGQVAFGRDGKMYVGFGDGGGGGDPDESAQNLRTLFGKLFAYGLRNPYRFSCDRRTGDLALAEVGQDAVEEIDFLRASRRAKRPLGGANFGWDVFEGRRPFEGGRVPRHVPPVIQRTHSQGSCSITGGHVIRDPSMGRLRGAYVYGDLCDSRLRVARLRSGRARGDRVLGPRAASVVSFGEDGRGRVHVVSLAGGVFRLARIDSG